VIYGLVALGASIAANWARDLGFEFHAALVMFIAFALFAKTRPPNTGHLPSPLLTAAKNGRLPIQQKRGAVMVQSIEKILHKAL
jgi:hypothetical protein